MNQIMSQAPDNITYEEVEIIFKKNNENIVDTLSELWEIKKPVEKTKDKWNDIRETCDAFDKEMDFFMDKHFRNK